MSSDIELFSEVSDESGDSDIDSLYENSLIWDSEDSRPAGPSPPSSDNLDDSLVFVAPRIGRTLMLVGSDSDNETINNSQQGSDMSTTASHGTLDGQDGIDDYAEMGSPIDIDSDATGFSQDTLILTDGEEIPEHRSQNNSPASPIQALASPPNERVLLSSSPVLNYGPLNVPATRHEIHEDGQNRFLDAEVMHVVHEINEPRSPPQFPGIPVLEFIERRSPVEHPPSPERPHIFPLNVPATRHEIHEDGQNRFLDAEVMHIVHEIDEPRSPPQFPGIPVLEFIERRSPVEHPPSPERPHILTPKSTERPSKRPALEISTLSDADEGSLCSICMDPLTNSGAHRVVCLRCGHIFGHACVERWIKVGCNNGAKRCPTCNKRAYLKDIRVLYLPKVVPLDTIEKDRLIKEKEELMMQKKAIEMELSRCKLQNTLMSKNYDEKISKLEKKLFVAATQFELLKQGKELPLAPAISTLRDTSKPELLHMFDVSKDGGCRVMAFNPILKDLVISQPSGNTVFAGFGVRVLNSVDYTPSRFVYLHQKMIRDLCFHPEDRDLLLSASLDQTAKLLDIAGNTTVHTFKGEEPLWACCWDLSNPHLLYVGSHLGKVCQYDRRMMDDYVNVWEKSENCGPVVALASVPPVANTTFPQGGFLSCRLNSAVAYARHGDKYSCQELQLEGPFMSMKYDSTTQTILLASRPSSRCPYVRISLNLLDRDEQGNVCLPKIHSFNCGSSARVMSRLTTVLTPDDSLVVAHHESGRSINMWSAKTGELVHSVPTKEPIIDFASLQLSNNKNILAALSDKKVAIYKIH